jgi:hypothetical protein
MTATRAARPTTQYLSIVSAASFLAFGAYLDSDDLEALIRDELERGGEALFQRELNRWRRGEKAASDVSDKWSLACNRILDAAADGRLTLEGRWAPPGFNAEPMGEPVAIPVVFYPAERKARRKLIIDSNNHLYFGSDSKRDMYCEVAVKTDEFSRFFAADWQPLTKKSEDEAETALEAMAAAWDERSGPIPVRRQFFDDWVPKIGPRPALRVWNKVADRRPSIKGGKNKPRPKRAG